jgi:hypothetical protein
MKDPYQILRQTETDIERVRKEIEALRFVIPLLAENGDRIERGPASPLSVAQVRGTGTSDLKGWPRTGR